MEILPYELVIEILVRLPAKSLMRFKSVSKLWLSLICSQYFTNRLLKVSSTPPRIYMWLGFDESPLKNVLLSSSSSNCPDSDGTIMSSFLVDQDLTLPAMEGYSVSQVFRGLVCFINGSNAKVYNATTRQLVALPDIEGSNIKDDENQKFMYHIGYDPVGDQYKVLCTVSTTADEEGRTYVSENWVLLLGGGGGDGSWRKISSQCPPHRPLTQRLSINGRIHYLAWVRLLDPVIVSFDIRSEEISIFQEPEKPAFWPNYTQLIEYGGRVAISHYSHFGEEGVLELWVMDDMEKNVWSRRKTFELHPSQLHLLDSISFLRVQGTTRDGEVILVPDNTYTASTGEIMGRIQDTFLFHIFLYNLQNNHMRRVEIKETSNRYLTKIWDVVGLDDVDNFMYL